ncbi:hypothetical protein [Streptomyces xantholiticus]|uniref:hypothetical protein n=1 Tax=Streptomyces xantholiticus TaxID=68285 RepID=UPI0016780C0E|nr:hypothetical protein [Streptomyces xantholiticus]GGW59894.1 hypothetical protein GCM10010381_51320 [Streptomyces xantholiticus]
MDAAGSSLRGDSPRAGQEGRPGREDFEGAALAEGDVAAAGARVGLADVLELGDGVTCRPGRGRPSPAWRPASEAEALGFGDRSGALGSSALATGTAASSSSEATVITHRVRSPGVTG